MAALAASSLSYFVAFGVLRGDLTEGKDITELVLWYTPLVLEVVSHYVASVLPGHVSYPEELISKRSATVFIIVLGGGMCYSERISKPYSKGTQD